MMLFLRPTIRCAKWELRTRLGRHYGLFHAYFRLFEHKLFRTLYQAHPELIIEGFGGSANSFAVYAFESAQPESIRIAHHLHVTAQITHFAPRGVPTIVILRQPFDAVVSLLSRDYYPSAHLALRHYTSFYTDVSTCAEHLIIARFEDVINDFPGVVVATNLFYGTSFGTHAAMHSRASEKLRGQDNKPRNLQATPNAERETAKEMAARRVSRMRDHRCFKQATDAYEALSALAVSTTNAEEGTPPAMEAAS